MHQNVDIDNNNNNNNNNKRYMLYFHLVSQKYFTKLEIEITFNLSCQII